MSKRFMIIGIVIVAIASAGLYRYWSYRPNAARIDKFYQWRQNPAARPDRKLVAGTQSGSAQFFSPALDRCLRGRRFGQ